MNKERIRIIITCFLVIILVFLWFNTVKVIKKRQKAQVDRPQALFKQLPIVDMLREKNISTEDIESQYLELDWLRCPFSGKHYGQEEVVASDLKISGIIWDGIKPQAIINDQILEEGDSIGNLFIEKIQRQKVILFDGKNRIELNI